MSSEIVERVELGTVVRLAREDLEDGWADGILVGKGPQFFIVQVVDDGLRLDGYSALRYADVSSIEAPSPRADFVERVLELRGDRAAERCPVDVSSSAGLVRSAGARFPLVTLHLEVADPGVCYVGEVVSVDDEDVRLRYVSPEGEWDEDADTYRLSEITRVDFGGAYEEALALFTGLAQGRSP